MMHRLVGNGEGTACGLPVQHLLAVRFWSYLNAFISRHPGTRCCLHCWPVQVPE